MKILLLLIAIAFCLITSCKKEVVCEVCEYQIISEGTWHDLGTFCNTRLNFIKDYQQYEYELIMYNNQLVANPPIISNVSGLSFEIDLSNYYNDLEIRCTKY